MPSSRCMAPIISVATRFAAPDPSHDGEGQTVANKLHQQFSSTVAAAVPPDTIDRQIGRTDCMCSGHTDRHILTDGRTDGQCHLHNCIII